MIRTINWLLSKLFPYELPSKTGVILAAQNIITDRARSAFDA